MSTFIRVVLTAELEPVVFMFICVRVRFYLLFLTESEINLCLVGTSLVTAGVVVNTSASDCLGLLISTYYVSSWTVKLC